MMRKTKPDYIDLHVGNRVKIARIEKGISQEGLGGKLGVTFQQVQKYEKGTNRIAPSRLLIVSDVTGRDIGWFFSGLPNANGKDPREAAKPSAVEIMAATRDGKLLADSFNTITSPRLRQTIVALVATLAAKGDIDA